MVLPTQQHPHLTSPQPNPHQLPSEHPPGRVAFCQQATVPPDVLPPSAQHSQDTGVVGTHPQVRCARPLRQYRCPGVMGIIKASNKEMGAEQALQQTQEGSARGQQGSGPGKCGRPRAGTVEQSSSPIEPGGGGEQHEEGEEAKQAQREL
jgi:hypothetical protein